MIRIMVAIVAFGLVGSAVAAQAEGRHKQHHRQGYANVVRAPQVGPIWAGPNQCWTDEGYGRFSPCNGRR